MSSQVRRTRWRLWIYLSLGSLGFIGFWYVAKKMGNRRSAGLGLIFLLVFLIAQSSDLGYLTFANFVAQLWFAKDINKLYLNFRSGNSELSESENLENSSPPFSPQINFNQANDFLVEKPIASKNENMNEINLEFPAKTDNEVSIRADSLSKVDSEPEIKLTKELIDINNESLETMISSLQISADTLRKIVEIRDQIGAFSSYEHLFKRADVRPHEMIKLKGRLAFGLVTSSPAPKDNKEENNKHRIVDL
jgi:DNA uptake protein ComE-like DNA-binding protein